jgi:hypothetical protein
MYKSVTQKIVGAQGSKMIDRKRITAQKERN